MMHQRLPALLLAALVGVIACKKEENFSSRISFVNAAVSNPSVTLKLDSQTIIGSLRYDSLIQATAPSGTFGVSLFINNTIQTSLTTNFEAGQSYVGMVYDTGTTRFFFLRRDAIPGGPGEGQCTIRFFNSVYKTTNLYLANDTGRGVITGLSFGNFLSSQSFTTIDTIKRLTVRVDSSLRAIDTLPQPLRSGKVYTIYYIGRVNDTISPTRKKFIIQTHN